jgi:predicted nucleic acid-binding protein
LILVDSSAWIEFLRATGSSTHLALRKATGANEPLGITGTVMIEVLGGARDEGELRDLRQLLARCRFVPLNEPSDHEVAAELYRACRREGTTVRRMADCLIAAVAIRLGVPVLHCDADFDVLARHTALTVATS